MVVRRLGERVGEGGLQLQPHGHDDLADEVVLGGEVVDDNAVTDAEALGEAPERELAEAVVERGAEGAIENVGFRVFVPHEG